MDKKSNKRSNSAYLTFSSCEQAAYAILSVDSIKIDNQLVRAFFGTTKYCNHFLNNFNCFNSEKCMFLHYLADKNDIIADNTKFGYSEHIKLAKKIIGFGSIQSQLYVMNNSNKGNSILPNIVTIYHKNDILIKTKNHRRKKSNESDFSNNIKNVDRTRSSSNSSNGGSSIENKEIKKIEENQFIFNNINIINDNDKNYLFKSRNKSRFSFANNNNKDLYNKSNDNLIEITKNLIDELSIRLSFFIQFNRNIPLKTIENDFCSKLYNKSKNMELKKIIENSF